MNLQAYLFEGMVCRKQFFLFKKCARNLSAFISLPHYGQDPEMKLSVCSVFLPQMCVHPCGTLTIELCRVLKLISHRMQYFVREKFFHTMLFK